MNFAIDSPISNFRVSAKKRAATLVRISLRSMSANLVSKLGTIISVSQTGVAEGVASVGDTLTLLVKKLSS